MFFLFFWFCLLCELGWLRACVCFAVGVNNLALGVFACFNLFVFNGCWNWCGFRVYTMFIIVVMVLLFGFWMFECYALFVAFGLDGFVLLICVVVVVCFNYWLWLRLCCFCLWICCFARFTYPSLCLCWFISLWYLFDLVICLFVSGLIVFGICLYCMFGNCCLFYWCVCFSYGLCLFVRFVVWGLCSVDVAWCWLRLTVASIYLFVGFVWLFCLFVFVLITDYLLIV